MSDIKRGKNRFYIGASEDQVLAEIHYLFSDEETVITIDHTYVSEELRGTGVGEELVKYIVIYAREENKKIIPLCPFAKSQIKRHKEYQDVLKHNLF